MPLKHEVRKLSLIYHVNLKSTCVDYSEEGLGAVDATSHPSCFHTFLHQWMSILVLELKFTGQ